MSKLENYMVLHLTLKKRWFDLIASGEKTEEYRDLKAYWSTRLGRFRFGSTPRAVKFVNGYGASRPTVVVELSGISLGYGREEWGAPLCREVYILKLGRILLKANF